MKTIETYKVQFKNEFIHFLNELSASVSGQDQQWTIKGFIDIHKNLYTISSDTKIISKLLEIHLFPTIHVFAEKIGYKIVTADKQNYYPDLTFICKEDERIKFAVDIKTTFRKIGRDKVSKVGFTLGSHGEYFQNRTSKKNIQFPYKEYCGHFCLAVVYSQVNNADEDVNDIGELEIFKVTELGTPLIEDRSKRTIKSVNSLQEVSSVIKDLKFYFAEKWKIASDSQGSGNTANIGSIKTEEDLKNETGVFYKLGEHYFDEYWLNYKKASILLDDGSTKKISSIWEYLKWKKETDKFPLIGNGSKRNNTSSSSTKKSKSTNKKKR